MSSGTEGSQEAPGIHWGATTRRADPHRASSVVVLVQGPSPVCDAAVSRAEEGAPPSWQSLALDEGRVTHGDRVRESDIAPGPLRLRVRTCDGREQSTDVRVVGEGQQIAATIDI